MRAEMQSAFKDVLSNVDRELAGITKDDERQLIIAADFVATARTPISEITKVWRRTCLLLKYPHA